MKLDGVYETDDATTPEKIRASGIDKEWERVWPLCDEDQRPGKSYPHRDAKYDPFKGWIYTSDLPADRDLVRDVARRIDPIECDDQRLIDWMKG
jgi:hypothetical protein